MYQMSVDYLSNGVRFQDADRYFEDVGSGLKNSTTCEKVTKEIFADFEKLGSDQAVEARIQGFLDGQKIEFSKVEVLVNRGEEVVEQSVQYVFGKINEWVEDYNYPDGFEDLENSVREGTTFENGQMACRYAGGATFKLPIWQAKAEMWPHHILLSDGLSEDRQSRIFAILLNLIEEYEAENPELEAA